MGLAGRELASGSLLIGLDERDVVLTGLDERVVAAFVGLEVRESAFVGLADRVVAFVGLEGGDMEPDWSSSFRERLDSIPDILDAMPFNEAIKTMMAWVSQELPQLGTRDQGTLSRESFDDTHECSNRVKSLTSEMEEGDQRCLWPFIRKLKFVQ